MPRLHLEDCSRQHLEVIAESLERYIAAGGEHLRPRLEAVRAQIPLAPPYEIEHKPRHQL